jgi:hypothetical protein
MLGRGSTKAEKKYAGRMQGNIGYLQISSLIGARANHPETVQGLS